MKGGGGVISTRIMDLRHASLKDFDRLNRKIRHLFHLLIMGFENV